MLPSGPIGIQTTIVNYVENRMTVLKYNGTRLPLQAKHPLEGQFEPVCSPGHGKILGLQKCF